MSRNELDIEELIKDLPDEPKEKQSEKIIPKKEPYNNPLLNKQDLENLNQVLIVDDDESQTKSIQKILKHKYDSHLCYNGEDAVNTFNRYQDQIVCIVLDIRLPDMNGFEVFTKIKETNGDIPIIFITGYQQKYGDGYDIFKKYRPHGYIIKNAENENEMIQDTIDAAVASYLNVLKSHKGKELEIRSQTIAGLIHDMGNLFMPIYSAPEIVLSMIDSGDTETGVDYLKRIKKVSEIYYAVQRIMFNYAKGENINLEIKPYNITKIFEEFVDLMGLQFADFFQIETHFNYDGEFPTDKIILRYQILLNIFKNAYEAMQTTECKITFSTYTFKDYVAKFGDETKIKNKKNNDLVITVSDNGPGIPEEIVDRIFDPFVTMGKKSGSGLGTYMIKHGTEELLGGEIVLENKPGEGVTYHLCFPA